MRNFWTAALYLLLLAQWGALQAATTTTLPSGDYLVVDTGYDAPGPVSNVGSVSLYSSTGTLISIFYGSKADDQVGSGGVTVIGNNAYVVCSPLWDNGSAADAGAVTFGSTTAFVSGAVSTSNSLVGSTANDYVGGMGPLSTLSPITTIGTTAFVVCCPSWDNGAATDAGAVAYSAVNHLNVGAISASNALVGSTAYDNVGTLGALSSASAITKIGTTAYVVCSPFWNNGGADDAGAVTYASTTVFKVGAVSANNSLVGSSANDFVGGTSAGGPASPITTIGSTGYLVCCPFWDNGAATDAGAVAYGAADHFNIGVISATNALVGSSNNDSVGGASAATNGSVIKKIGSNAYVVCSPFWDNGGAADAGAVTYGSTTVFPAGPISATNSLVGSSANDGVGGSSVASTAITTIGSTGYLVCCPYWDNGAASNAGAVAYGAADHINVGTISASNALVGSSMNDFVGGSSAFSSASVITKIGTTAFLVSSPTWDNRTASNAGAVTYGSTTFFNVGAISSANSLVGSHPGDYVASGGITINGTVITVTSPHWCYNAGATSVGSTATGIFGVVSAANSTVGAESSIPEIDLQQPAVTDLASNGSRQFGIVNVGDTATMAFVIKNSGTDDLLLSGLPRVSITGADAAAFTVDTQPSSLLVTGDSDSFTVAFTPTSSGSKTAVLSIASNDSNENPYLVNLSGTAVLPISNWRQTYFGSTANNGTAADSADYDHDGIPNLLEYAFGLNPSQSTSSQLPAPSRTGGNFVYTFDEPSGVTGLTYGAEWTGSLSSNTWQAVSDTGTPPHHVFSVPMGALPQMFMRLKVTAP